MRGMNELPPNRDTIERWLSGPRFSGLPAPRDLPPPKLSFEFFPPKSDKMEAQLWDCVRRLEPLAPRFVSVTDGAGGSTRSRTHATVSRILRETSLTPAAHLTTVGSTREEIAEIAQEYWAAGVRHVVALRGDPPAGADCYTPHPGGYAQAEDLVRGLRGIADFDISVGAYPETHPQAVSAALDVDYLKRKLDAGASRAITQYFFDADVYLRFLERCHRAGIAAPVVPGILPVTNFEQVTKFSAMCGASVPAWLGRLFEGTEHDEGTRRLVAAVVAAEQVRLLQANGVDEFHIYTLNRADLAYAIAHVLGARPVSQAG